MRFFLYALAAAAMAGLTACANSPDQITRDSHLNMQVTEALAREDRAVVFGSMAHTDMMNMAEPLIYFEIQETPSDANGRRTMSISDDLNLAGTWPGSYALKQLYMPANLFVYNFAGWAHGEQGALGRFDVAPGEVIYIGHLVFRSRGNSLAMTVEDRFNEFRADLPPDLAARVQKRLITVPEEAQFNTQSVTLVR